MIPIRIRCLESLWTSLGYEARLETLYANGDLKVRWHVIHDRKTNYFQQQMYHL